MLISERASMKDNNFLQRFNELSDIGMSNITRMLLGCNKTEGGRRDVEQLQEKHINPTVI